MLKSVLSTITALTALSLIASAPASAAKLLIIKVPSHNVKLQPKVQPRVKLQAAKPRVAKMPKLVIRKTAKVIAAKKVTPKAVGAARIKKVKPLNNRMAGDGSVKPSLSGKIGKLSELGHIGNLKQDAAAAKDMLQLMDRKGGLDMSSFRLGPANGAENPATPFKPDTPAQSRFNRDGGIGDIAGVDSGIYGFLGNSHGKAPMNTPGSSTSDGAKGAWAVTPGSIANAMGGVSGEKTGGGSVLVGQSATTDLQTGAPTVITEKRTERGDTIIITEEMVPGVSHSRTVEVEDWNGHPISRERVEQRLEHHRWQTEHSTTDVPGPHATRPGLSTGTTRLTDPDSGYSGPSPFPWIKEEKSKNIRQASGGKTPGAMTGAPDGANETPQNGQQAMFTQKDLLETWDDRLSTGDGPVNLINSNPCKKTDC